MWSVTAAMASPCDASEYPVVRDEPDAAARAVSMCSGSIDVVGRAGRVAGGPVSESTSGTRCSVVIVTRRPVSRANCCTIFPAPSQPGWAAA
ncbi:hypothetical protein OHB01_14345 [Microbispora hainanensis]|uniref:hypothetical protein n=1 Tax=Microbispora hainanensis TaxID=568844 RepID=UPI002E2A057C|nr:hypothetical protein [Microbispora hainanensis]